MNWEQIRVNAAIAAMQSLVSIASFTDANREKNIAILAVEQANALVEELKNNKEDKK